MKIKLTTSQAVMISRVSELLKKESPDVQSQLKNLVKKLLGFNGKQFKDEYSEEIEVTDDERISMYRCIIDVFENYREPENNYLLRFPKPTRNEVFDYSVEISKLMEFDIQLNKKFNLGGKIDIPKDFKFNDEHEILTSKKENKDG